MSERPPLPGTTLEVSLTLVGKLIVGGKCEAFALMQGDFAALVQTVVYACKSDADLFNVIMASADYLRSING